MTIEKVKAIAKEKHGMDMTDDMATKYIEKYSKNGKLSDSELDNVTGGYGCGDIEKYTGKYCEPCGVWCDDAYVGVKDGRSFKCPVCGAEYY